MPGRNNGRGRGHKGPSGRGGGGRGGSRARTSPSSKTTAFKGQTAALGDNIYTCGEKNSADKMKTTNEKVARYLGSVMSQDICWEITNRIKRVIKSTEYPQDILDCHTHRVATIKHTRELKRDAQQKVKTVLDNRIAADRHRRNPRIIRSGDGY